MIILNNLEAETNFVKSNILSSWRNRVRNRIVFKSIKKKRTMEGIYLTEGRNE